MAKGGYIGTGGVARKLKSGYIGVANLARKIKKGYIGVAGVARPIWSSGPELIKYGSSEDGAVEVLGASGNGAATMVGDYALFGGADSYAIA